MAKKDNADFVYQDTFEFDPEASPFDKVEYETNKYKRGILPRINELKKELSKNKKETKKEKEENFKLLLNKKSNHRNWTFEYENGEVYPKEVSFPDIRFIQYPEPHVLITGLYDSEEEWYRLRGIIEDFSEEAYLSYEMGFWFASISSVINCCEYILKYELFRYLNKNDKTILQKASKDYNLTLGRIKNNAYACLDLLKIKSIFYDKLDYLNLVRNSIYHFNPKKAKKVSQKGILEVEKSADITDDMVIPIITYRVYSIMIELINHFYNKQKALEYVNECVADWMKKRGLNKKDLEKMKINKNQPCPCGSGKKYKKCCMEKSDLGYQLHLKGKNAENFVNELAKKSFLEDWCYMNPKLPKGKEICDLLIVYDNIAIIWQIKDLKLDKNRKYKESEVQKNLNQISTAKNRLFGFNLDIELENPRRGKEIFNPKSIKKIYAISALLGEDEDYFSFIENIKDQTIHVFTREFTEIILNELDTIQDFIQYLEEKERLIELDNRITLIGGEKELLAYYIMNERSFNNLKEANMLMFDEGSWDELQKRPEYLAKKEEDKISYGWDSIINRAHTCGGDYEQVARELARPNRFHRRLLAKSFYDAHVLAHNEKVRDTFRRLMKSEDTTYCFIFLKETIPSEKRKAYLSTACFVARGKFKENKKVIGISTEMKIRPTCSYDFCLLYLPEWTDEEEKKMKEIQEHTGIFANPDLKKFHEDEYPNVK